MSDEGFAFALIFFSAVTHASYNALIKSSADKLVARQLMATVSSLILLPAAFFVPFPSGAMWTLLLGTAVVHFAYQMCQIMSLHHTDYTLVYPVARGSAPLIVAVAVPFVLGDTSSLQEMVGIVVISVSILSMALFGRRGAQGRVGLGLAYAVLTGIAIATYTVIDAKGVRMGATPFTFIVWFFLLDCLVISTFTLARRGTGFRAAARPEIRRAAVNGILGICTFGSALWAFDLGNAAVMAACRESSVLFAAIIGTMFLSEKLSVPRLIAVGGILTGVLIIRLA